MKKFLTRSRRQYIAVALVTAAVLSASFLCAYFIFVAKIRNGYEERITEMEQNKRTVLVVKEKISAGSQITKENTAYHEVFSDVPKEYFVGPKELGKLALVDLEQGTHILKNMIAPEGMEDGLREEEFSLFHLNQNLRENDFVDIRILFPNGENFIVLSKKSIKGLNLADNGCYLWISEDEILSLSSAIIDAYLHEGTKLYTSKYIEPSIQDESTPTYVPNADVIGLMREDPNILEEAKEGLEVQAREALEGRLNRHKEKYGPGSYSYEWNGDMENGAVGGAEEGGQEQEETYGGVEEPQSEIPEDVYYVN